MNARVISSLVIVLLLSMAACQKDQDINPSVPVPQNGNVGNPYPGDSGDVPLKISSFTEFAVSPKFGKPNSTYYYFKVYDLSGALPLSLKLYERSTGTTTYVAMQRSGYYWVLYVPISTNGWYDYRYVYSATKANISPTSYVLCNTRNVFSLTGTSSISWPFGADGSSWNNRVVSINGSSQTWRGGEETKGTSYHYGYGWDEGTHINSNERYSDDWNRGTGSQDLGAIIRSPLDGYVAAYGTYFTSLGNSKYVAIVQEGSDGKLYRFYVGHLQSYPSTLFIGQYVRAGVSQIGTLGSSGASSPHAHTNMRNITNGANTAVKFYFNAQWYNENCFLSVKN